MASGPQLFHILFYYYYYYYPLFFLAARRNPGSKPTLMHYSHLHKKRKKKKSIRFVKPQKKLLSNSDPLCTLLDVSLQLYRQYFYFLLFTILQNLPSEFLFMHAYLYIYIFLFLRQRPAIPIHTCMYIYLSFFLSLLLSSAIASFGPEKRYLCKGGRKKKENPGLVET